MEYKQCDHYLKLSANCAKDVLDVKPCIKSECSEIEGKSKSSIIFEIEQLKKRIRQLEQQL